MNLAKGKMVAVWCMSAAVLFMFVYAAELFSAKQIYGCLNNIVVIYCLAC